MMQKQNHPDFYDELCQTPSKSVIDETFDFDDQNWKLKNFSK